MSTTPSKDQAEGFLLPDGYKVWCHVCGRGDKPLFTEVLVNGVIVHIAGFGAKSWEESQEHHREYHVKGARKKILG